MTHTDWCSRTAQDHAACYRQIGTVTIGPETTAVVDLHKTRDVPATVRLTTVRGPGQSVLPLNVDAADQLASLLDQGVAFIVRPAVAASAGQTATRARDERKPSNVQVRVHPHGGMFLIERTRHGMVIVDFDEARELIDKLLYLLAVHDRPHRVVGGRREVAPPSATQPG